VLKPAAHEVVSASHEGSYGIAWLIDKSAHFIQKLVIAELVCINEQDPGVLWGSVIQCPVPLITKIGKLTHEDARTGASTTGNFDCLIFAPGVDNYNVLDTGET
jgi:hypothetical protein